MTFFKLINSAHWTGHLMFSLKTNSKLRIFTKCWPILPVLVVLFLLFSFIKTISFIGSKNRESTGFGIDVLHTKIQSYAKIDLYKSNFKKLIKHVIWEIGLMIISNFCGKRHLWKTPLHVTRNSDSTQSYSLVHTTYRLFFFKNIHLLHHLNQNMISWLFRNFTILLLSF